jgi:chromate reductase
MITIISGTNRKDSMTLRIARVYYNLFLEKTENVHLLSLEDLNVWERNEALIEVEQRYLIPADKFVFVMPEYNGSFPGILKLMMDNSDIRKCWWYKKAMLAGLADGRAGNLRGLDHMTNILNYLRIQVFYNKIPISRIFEEMSLDGHLMKSETEKVIRAQVNDFLNF